MELHKEREAGQEAERVLKSPAYIEAWDAYRLRILEEIEAAKSTEVEKVMHLKRLLTAAAAAKAHLERIMKEGVVAARAIELEEKRRGLRRVFG